MKFEEYLSSLRGKSVAVIGIGVSNQPLIRLLLDRGIQVTACDKKTGRTWESWETSWNGTAAASSWGKTI